MNKTLKVLQLSATAVAHATPPATEEVVITGMAHRLTPGTSRSGEAPSPGTAPVAVAADHVVRVEFENGLVMWMRADDLLRERGIQRVRRSGNSSETEIWEIDPAPRLPLRVDTVQRGTERGALGLGIKVLEFFGVDLKKKSATVLGKKFEERQLKTAPGLYRCAMTPGDTRTPGPALTAVSSDSLPKDQPLLIFLHGTMSSMQGSFGALWTHAGDDNAQAAATARAALSARYGEHIYAFQHRSLTESPIQNALDLVRQLPKGAQLHLVSHSRGGLVGEVLSLAGRERSDDPLQAQLLDQLFAADRTVAEQLGLGALDGAAAQARDQAYGADRTRLQQLLALMDEQQLQVRRFVRVACPARGTTLASGRLDRWLSVINMLTGNGLIGDVADFMLAVIKERTDPRALPGLEAMMPGSALTRLLHHPSLRTRADLSVIAGDIEGQGLWAQLKLLAADWFYSGDHDLVVNTGSMLGGIRRPDGGARFLRDQGEQVNHFNYFTNKKSVAWLVNGLLRDEAQDGGFSPITEARQEEPRWRSAVRASRAASGAGSAPRPIAIMVPGTMGSAIEVRGKRVWLSYWSLLRGGLADIGWGANDVAPVDVLDDFYSPLLEHLARTHRVEIFPYDWRQSVREAAKKLAEKIADLLPEAERSGQPIQIVAHSMGGLVSRAMIADDGPGAQVWRRMTANPNSRLLMLGTPNLGSHEAVRWLTGGNPTQAKLALLDFTRGVHGIIDIVSRFPGMLELLPFDEHSRYDQAQVWKQLKSELAAGWPLAEAAALRGASNTWALLKNAAPDPAHMVYVAGCQPATVTDYRIVDDDDRFPRKKIEFLATAEGDGTVTWASGRLAGVPTYYAPDTAHDALCSNDDDRRIFRGYVELLLTGKTDQLPASPPLSTRAAARSASGFAVESAASFVLPPLPVTDDLPDEAAVRGLGFGGGLRPREPRKSPQRLSSVIEVHLRHGDLAYARYPVLVGHYVGDTIVSAELALDKRMQGALSRRRDLGLYPGPLGTHAVFFNEKPDAKPAGALLVGLGQVGELSPGRLEAGVRDVMLDYALRVLQRPLSGPDKDIDKERATEPRRARISCLLVGTGGSVFHLRDSIEALLRGALAANRKLEAAGLDQKVLIDRIEILEIYEDIAINAAKELAAILDAGPLNQAIRWPQRCIEEGEGRRLRRNFDSDASWWQRLEIVEERRADRLRFIATTDRARAEETLAAGQLRLADAFIAQACGSASSNADIAKTLFEMLLPNRLKESAPDQRDLVLLLDEASARFPWELLEDRASTANGQNGRPPAVASGLVRQLKTAEFRLRPAHAFENTIYVVGNPDLGGWQSFADLPGARREAELVGRVFREQGYILNESIDEKADGILSGLHARPWRVMHLAGHGEHEFELADEAIGLSHTVTDEGNTPPAAPKRVSGMVIGKNTFLTPGDVEQMRHVPELVFINCCHLGQTQTRTTANFNRLAANLGVQFIRMGVKAVVAAGWAVDDGAALTFAETFYRQMFNGESFGEAVRRAREATWSAHPGANTWGAYQCYGDPAFSLQRESRSVTKSLAPLFFSPSEAVAELRNLCEATRMTSKEQDDDTVLIEKMKARIEAIRQRIPLSDSSDGSKRSDWLERADVAAALGMVYGEGRLFADAVYWLNKALSSTRGDCPIRAVEQCANFQVRLAAQEWAGLRVAISTAKGTRGREHTHLQTQQAAIAERIEAAIRELDVLNQRATTTERLNLLGSACKRLAWVQIDIGPRVEALLNMAQYYRLAWEAGGQTDCYAFNNWALACLLLAAIDPVYQQGNWHDALAEMALHQISITSKANEEDPNLWHATGLADLEVTQLLLAADRPDVCQRHGQRAAQLYCAAFERGASLREMASIEENMDFLIALVADWPPHVVHELETIRQTL